MIARIQGAANFARYTLPAMTQHAARPARGANGPRARHLALAATLLLLLAAACASKAQTPGGTASPSSSSSSSQRPSTPAVIAIVQPTSGETVTGTTLNVVLTLANATLEPPGVTTTVVPTEGHIHLSLDGSIVSMTGSLTQQLAVNPGPHILQAEFVANDHGPFYPRDIVSVAFTDTQ